MHDIFNIRIHDFFTAMDYDTVHDTFILILNNLIEVHDPVIRINK